MNLNAIKFKSSHINYIKEQSGKKPNTFRIFDQEIDRDDERFDILFVWKEGDVLKIEITDTQTGECFQRNVEDVTWWGSSVIISWRHEA